jgi:two-component system nitrate/nitrite response regulator NarL
MAKSVEGIRTLIAHPQASACEQLSAVLRAQPGFRVAGAATDGVSALRAARNLRPDVMLLDLGLKRVGGLECFHELARARSTVRVILLIQGLERTQIITLLQLGARGLLRSEAAVELCGPAIRAVARGEYWLGRESVPNLSQAHRKLTPPAVPELLSKGFGLSPPERRIVLAAALGYTHAEIAQKTSLCEAAVRNHFSDACNKLGVSSRLELTLFALSNRLFS